ncbi:MAG: AAA family ATPase [Acidobacteriia bacterium]|nr:AAA family ATPase [Terriglobia bacterium]
MSENVVPAAASRRSLSIVDLQATLSEWLNIPAGNLMESWNVERLQALEDHLRRHIVGQDEAIAHFMRDFRKSVVLGRGTRDSRPMIAMLCVGPSGVGKTEIGRRIAEFIFGDAGTRFLMVNCAQFSEEHTLSAFWGAPPGYVGYGQPTLLDHVRRNPFSVVLFDEIEKMHPKAVTDLLVGLLGDGNVRDLSFGKLVSFTNTLVLFTSNLGNDFAARQIGYSSLNEDKAVDAFSSAPLTRAALEAFFRPEILGRFDSIVSFHHLDDNALGRILDLELDALSKEKLGGDRVVLSPESRRVVLREADSLDFGARNLKQIVKNRVEGGITNRILEGAIRRTGDETIAVDVRADGQFTFDVHTQET